MKIASSDVTMASARSARKSGVSRNGSGGMTVDGREADIGVSSWKNAFDLGSGIGNGERGSAEKQEKEEQSQGFSGKSQTEGSIFRNSLTGSGLSSVEKLLSAGDTGGSSIISIRNRILQILMQRFESAGITRFGSGIPMNSVENAAGRDYITVSQASYYEEESTLFSARGCALTEDGRSIDFGVELAMTRTFMEYTSVTLPNMASVLMDPLMINVSAATATVSDQKFLFDLDADGTKEYISMPASGTGFLALDKDGSGTIDNGSELFGTQSGDGFADLAEYDSDGNGWIDENDDIYDKLRVWYRNADGTDELIDLKRADVGAIFLGERATEFSLNSIYGQTDAVIRSTGIFLKESGGVGTVQHVDLNVSMSEASGSLADSTARNGSIGSAAGTDSSSNGNFINVFGPDGWNIPGWGSINGGFGSAVSDKINGRFTAGVTGLDGDHSEKNDIFGDGSLFNISGNTSTDEKDEDDKDSAVDELFKPREDKKYESRESESSARRKAAIRRHQENKRISADLAERARYRRKFNQELVEKHLQEHEDEEQRIEELLTERAQKGSYLDQGEDLDETLDEMLVAV